MKIFEVELREGVVEYVLLEREDGSQETMLKSVYDERQAQLQQFTPMVSDK
jgi:hypothetical protein